MRKISTKKLIIGGVAFAVVGAGAGTAFAYFTDSGSGSGSTTVGTSSHFTVTVDQLTSGLLPGGPSATVNFVVTNNSAGSQKVTGADLVEVANADGSAWTAVSGCSASDFAISNVSLAPTDLTANGTAGDHVAGSFSISMVDANASQDACKGATVPLYVHVQ